MNTEQLKLVIEMISGLGAGTKEAFIIWVVAHEILPTVLTFVGLMVLLFIAFKLLGRLLLICRSIEFLKRMRDQLDIGSHGCFLESEFVKTTEEIEKRVSK